MVCPVGPWSKARLASAIECKESEACSNTCVDCQWSHWDTWSVCSQSCEGAKLGGTVSGQQSRSRRVAVARRGLGANCSGAATEQRVCGMDGCPVDCEYEAARLEAVGPCWTAFGRHVVTERGQSRMDLRGFSSLELLATC